MKSWPSLVASVLAAVALAGCNSEAQNDGARAEGTSTTTSTPSTSPSTTASEEPKPEGRRDLAFAVIGDFGVGTLEQLSVAARMCDWHEEHPFDIVITTGDNIYPDGSPDMFESAFFKPYKCLFDEGVRWHASLGNHDWLTDEGQPELDEPAFGMEGENYVVQRAGVRFVIANSNALDRTWLRQNLPPEKGDRWTVVAFHHPVFSPGMHGSTETFADLPALFEKTGVDLVLNGHDHIYAVSKPLSRIRYVVTGGGGAPLYGCSQPWFSARCEMRHHFLDVVAGKSRLVVRAVPSQGRPFHRFSTAGRA